MPIETPLLLAGRMSLPRLLWRQNHDLVRKTLEIPFIRKLRDGSLQEDIFDAYVQQDRYFKNVVDPYKRFIKSQTDDRSGFDSNNGIEILREQMESGNSLNIVPSPETINYIKYIFANSYSLSTAATSLLPCSKLYRFLTNYLSRIKPSDKCMEWIKNHTYTGYKNNTNQLEYLINLYGGENIGNLYINNPSYEGIRGAFKDSIARNYNALKDDFGYTRIARVRDLVARELKISDNLFDTYLKRLYKEEPHWISFTYSGAGDKITEKGLPIVFEKPMREFFTLLKVNEER
mgnify:CR=1 FL=1